MKEAERVEMLSFGQLAGPLLEIVNSRQSGFGKALTSAGWEEYQVHWGATESAGPAEKCPTDVITENQRNQFSK